LTDDAEVVYHTPNRIARRPRAASVPGVLYRHP
jgi:hypothetical protein